MHETLKNYVALIAPLIFPNLRLDFHVLVLR